MTMETDELNHPDYGYAFEAVLRAECSWQAPPELSARLFSLASTVATTNTPAAMQSTPIDDTELFVTPPPQPVTWYSVLVLVLTSIAVGLSFAITWEVYGAVGASLGLDSLWHQLQSFLARTTLWLSSEMPAIHTIVHLITTIYDQISWLLNWLLIAMVLWLALDDHTPQSTHVRQRQLS
jgi:hypothetical protein